MDDSSCEDRLLIKLKGFCEINEQFAIAFKVTEAQANLARNEKNELHLNYIAHNILVNDQYFEGVISHFSEYLPKIISVAISFGKKNAFQHQRHLANCIILGKLVKKRPDLKWYASVYFQKHQSPFIDNEIIGGKRARMAEKSEIADLDLIEAIYSLVKSNPASYKNNWDWSTFSDKYLHHSTIEVQWIACHCIAIITGMSEQQLQELITSKITLKKHEELSCKFHCSGTLTITEKSRKTLDQHPCISITKQTNEEVIEISGVYIPKLPTPSSSTNLILVESTSNNLKKIALGLSTNKAICLQGPVGSGKTSLVEYLAAKTGRKLGENFVKVQLGDQTDSKMLLGTYRCTDIPGEFVWQPGVVTQAVIDGHWLLLEDVDSASMDIASVLSSLLENGTLTVPGYRDALPISPGFQLFFTQRLVSTITGHHKKHSNAMSLLDKHLLQINIDPLSPPELKHILTTRHPEFSTIADRMLSVFHLFSKDISNELTVPKTSRLISTRDFFKWCSRAAQDFDIKSQASALKVLQDAIDVFCGSYPRPEDALNLAREISTHLGIINQKAEFFFKSYKPSMKMQGGTLTVGRAVVHKDTEALIGRQNYFFTRPSAVLLERIMCCVNLNEPVLLVGETGTGKTSSVQYLSTAIGQKLLVINMNQQSDSADLLGGFKPVDLKFVISPIRRDFEHVFCDFFQIEPNRTFLSHISHCYNEQRWPDLVLLMMKSQQAAIIRLNKSKKDAKNREMFKRWLSIGEKLHKLNLQLKQKSALAFAFIEGSLVKAVEQGHWVLLDEINLANAETLECLSGLLEGSDGSLCLLERGDKKPVKRNPNFTLFACMNPSTDVGKKDLPPGLRNRFTEFYVDELTEKNDLLLLVGSYLHAQSMKDNELSKIVDFYLKVRKETETTLTDGLGHKPHFSLRSLCRALTIAAKNPCGMFKKSLYEAFCLSFLTQLDAASYLAVERMVARYLIGDEKALKAVVKQPIPEPKVGAEKFVKFEGYWVRNGALECSPPEDYILTDSVRKNLKDLVRIVSIGGLPVLLQGDTSVGKTSLITYLAKSSGNKCVRINNHEHTDLQEYIGSYVADSDGKLVFREGLLVEAMRKGHWIILDELNLAPTDVLEALNRVLDDNRELFIPETQETVKADPNFMLFATQNPPGSYGGRKMLSRAFRNRFVELHFNEIPPMELEFILHKRCEMAPSYAKKMISVMTDLQMRRRGSAAFAGKQGFITLRDLFRWGERYRLAQNSDKLYDWDQHLADEGYLILAGRVRRLEEKREIIDVLQKQWKRRVKPQLLFTLSEKTSTVTKAILTRIEENKNMFTNIVWTYNMRQLAVLVAKAFEFKEPVLLVGETGGGKTTVCRLIAEQNSQELVTVNCHMHTESSDFIGGLRPVRDHVDEDINKLFEWVDGPLIQAMVKGNVFLADEISLADDSVLERLNSLLEPERTLLVAEKGSDLNNATNSELIVANNNFYFIGTMNPGGDFGKKELSPALRNRFTEIWCESCTDRNDLIAIIEQNLKSGISFGNQQDGSSGVGSRVMDFVAWLQKSEIGKRLTVSIRDILTWVTFINKCSDTIEISEAYLHGASLTFLDGLGSGITGTENLKSLDLFKKQCRRVLKQQLKSVASPNTDLDSKLIVHCVDNNFGIKPFYIPMGETSNEKWQFSFNAPTTVYNTLRLLRGMQLNKAILLEGSPGVGKTSLVTALAKASRHKIFRVNLSDQTDVSDLFGADLPVEGGTGGQFSWRDGPLLQALKQGHWILLDELNLASQSVLEGLNACLDHRGEIFIPELSKTFYVKGGTRFFACQNPLKQGGSRRGLPQSFLNRFIQVHVDSLSSTDLQLILGDQFPELPPKIIQEMLLFNSRILGELEEHRFGHRGSPWEFNLRDVTRWCEATLFHCREKPEPGSLVRLIYSDRMRTLEDKEKISEVFAEVFGREISGDGPVFYANKDQVFVGDVSLEKRKDGVELITEENNSLVLRTQLPALRSLAYCVNLNWMCLLVGSSASGKSAIVHLLANLIGKTLRTLPVTSAMDTTDILGGFEQTDYARHLEDLVKQTERLLFQTIRNRLIKDRPCVSLLRLWEDYSLADVVNTDRTMEEETKIFLQKLEKLEKLWMALAKCEDFCENETIDALRLKARKISQCVQKDGSLNAGGKFEWVDSVLIKCLQEGSWLLVDNVNLCSAAVLDRLNALLEPNGVLTVGERGVDEDGKMVEIKPHPDFRLFLTMDPKNGEISRAMRNRGVEIYMLNDKETNSRNDLDLRSLLKREGLTEIAHIEALLHLHDFVSDLILGEKPNLNELLRAASLISQQIRHGTTLSNAFSSTILEVYYKTRSSMEFSCNDFNTVICTEVKEILAAPDVNSLFNEDITLKTDQLQIATNLQLIKQQSTFLRDLGEEFTNEMKYFLVHFYGVGSRNELRLRQLYCNHLFKNGNVLAVSNALSSFISGAASSCKEFPADCQWILETNYEAKNRLISNLLVLGLHIVANFKNEELNTLTKEIKMKKQVSLKDYMKSRQLNRVDDQFDDTLIEKFLTLIDEYDKFLLSLPKDKIELNDENVVKILQLLTWRYLLWNCVLVNVRKINATQRHLIVTNLKVHYRWFLKYSVTELVSLVNKKLPKKLETVLNDINKSLEREFSELHRISKSYQKCDNKPPPRVSESEIEVATRYFEINKTVDTCHKNADLLRILTLFREDPTLRTRLIEIKIGNGEDRLIQLKSIDLSELPVAKLRQYETELLPFTDYFLRLKVWLSAMGENNCDDYRGSLVIPIDLVATLLLYHQTKDRRLQHHLFESFYSYLRGSAGLRSAIFYSQAEETNLSGINPALTYHTTKLLLGEEGIVTKFGNYRDLAVQHRKLHLTLWRNLQQLHDDRYDYLSLERQLVADSFITFIRSLSESLGLSLSSVQLVDDCLKRLGTLDGEFGKSFIAHLTNCKGYYGDLKDCEDFDMALGLVANLHMELSYAKALVNSRLPLIDPSAKKALKKKYCVENIRDFDELRRSFVSLNEVYSGNERTLHSHHTPVVETLKSLEKRNEKLGGYVAVRPHNVLYEDVVKAVNHGFSTILSPQYVDKMLVSFKRLIKADEAEADSSQMLKQCQSTVSSFENLLSEWAKYRAAFPDVIEPLLGNASEFVYGFKSSLALLERLIQKNAHKKFNVDVQRELLNLVRIPNLDQHHISYEELINAYTKPKLHDFLTHIVGGEEKPDVHKVEILRLFKCGIQESFNNCIIQAMSSGMLTTNAFAHFDNLVKAFVDSYNQQERTRELEEKEADSLYKTRTKCDDKTEEQQTQEELKELFPNFHDTDFADLQNNVLTDDPLENPEEATITGFITLEDVKFVADLHLGVLHNFTKAEWLNPTKNSDVNPDFVNPLIEKYKVFKLIAERTIHGLDYRMDKELMDSMCVLNAFVQNYNSNSLVDVASPSKQNNKNRYDFYKHSNVDEVKSSFHILEEVKVRVSELLSEWPDQPTLKTIITIIERLYSFDITSPISRFLTGFEVLLNKCHEWEEVAHSGVTLSQFAQNITQQVIAWRKMELNVWKDLLNTTFNRVNTPIYKWWIYLYNVMEQYLNEDKFSDFELIETLQNYITKSNLSEFERRLKLLYGFHCHVVHFSTTKKSKAFISILWNLYCYFGQFIDVIARKIKDLRTPIEKKLKEYVTIVKWKDVNYWAIKETVDKSHKTLHKYVKEFQEVLKQPVSPFLVNSTDPTKVDNVGIWDRPQRHAVKTYHYTLEASSYIVKDSLKEKLNPNDDGFDKIRRSCRDSIGAMKYPDLIVGLDGFVTQIIETSTHLQGLEVDTTLPKNKQKSLAKSILNQKHRALADLFKTLSKIGLSFKSGIVESKLKMATEDFLLKPIDINASFSHINCSRKDVRILTIWDSCEMYYSKSLMRADVLDTALKAPAKDLGLQNIERCRGFSSNLLSLILKIRSQLTESTSSFYNLRYYSSQLMKLFEGKQFLSLNTIEQLCKTMNNITIVMNQTSIFLNSCPEENFANHDLEIVVLQPEPPNSLQYKYDPLWNKAKALIKEILNDSAKIASDVCKAKGEIPSLDSYLLPLKFVPIPDLKLIASKLKRIVSAINELCEIFGKLKVSESLSWLREELNGIRLKLSNPKSSHSSLKLQNYVEQFKNEITSAIQLLNEKYSQIVPETTEEEEDLQIKEEHLKNLIANNLQADVKSLNVAKILKQCSKIANILFSSHPKDLDQHKTTLFPTLLLLEQLILFYQYFITQQVSAYRVACKMSSILLNIFINLASNGFCVAPEFDENMEEGEGKATDGLGLGDGKGERDVSDKIESEDQLDDAQPAGQEKEKEEDPDCKEEDKGIEMSEDFDSKLQDMKDKDDDDEESDKNSDAEEQMGDTEKDANKQEKETFGSDQEDEEGDEEEESEQKEDKGDGGEKEGEQQLAAKENQQSKEDETPDDDSKKEKEEKKKEINELEEPEFDDDQTDPYHGNQPELPEPEEMDLPDDLQLDEGQDNENDDQNEENPFDIDAMKEDNPFEDKDKDQEEDDEKEGDEQRDFSSDDEEITKVDDDHHDDGSEGEEDQKQKEETETETKNPEMDEEEIEETENKEESAFDQTQTNEENVEAMEVDNAESTDKTQANQSENQKSSQPIDELCQEDRPDKEGIGQSQMEESSTGHSAQTTAPQEMQKSKRQRDEEPPKKQKPGESDTQRSLGDVNEPVKKKLKTIDSKNNDNSQEEENEKNEEETEMYQHIKEAKQDSTQVLDVATKEQADLQKEVPNLEEEEKGEEATESSEKLPEEDEEVEVEAVDGNIQKPEKTESKDKKKGNKKQHPEGDILEEIKEVDIEGEVVDTMNVPRGIDTTYHTLYDEISKKSSTRLTMEEVNSLRCEVENQLSTWSEAPSDADADRTWQKISSMTSGLAQDLSEQLRLVLEPTQTSRLKGDFRTGRRINMRKVIPYIASQFRKDKIWLRRTKPSKREYQIVLAIDDSSSMADNHSKELAFESVALISKALTLLESGQLSVLSFGENTEILHKLTDQFTERSGVKLLQKFKFDQNKTCVAKLVDFVSEMFGQTQLQSTALNAKLLVIVSDGRGVFSEGESFVKQAVRRAKLSNIFMVFVIIDNPENKSSILDIRMPTFRDGKLTGIQSYMDVFPFSFYIVLRDINSLPNVLSDALRQWFEIVSNLDKQ